MGLLELSLLLIPGLRMGMVRSIHDECRQLEKFCEVYSVALLLKHLVLMPLMPWLMLVLC